MLIPSEDKVLELFKGHFTWKVTLRATNFFIVFWACASVSTGSTDFHVSMTAF